MAAVIVILIAALPPQPDWPAAGERFVSSLWPAGRRAWFDFLSNVALYVPLGLVVSARGRGVLAGWLVGSAVSVSTELLQLWVPGRDASARDIVANTLGAFLGSVAAGLFAESTRRNLLGAERALARAAAPGWQLAAWLSNAWALVLAAILTLTGFLLIPALPDHPYVVSSPFLDRLAGPLWIGADPQIDGSFAGTLDEVRIYRRALTTAEIRKDMLQPIPTAAAHHDLVAAYGFDAVAESVAKDDSGWGHDGVIRGAVSIEHGRFGHGLSFDGTNGEVVVAASPDLELVEAMTLEAWIFPIRQRGTSHPVIAHAGDSYFLSASSEAGALRSVGGGRFASLNDEARLARRIPDKQWRHLALTYDGQAIRLYVDGDVAETTLRWSSHRHERLSLNGHNLPFGPVANRNQVRAALMGNLRLGAAVTCGAAPNETAPLLRLVGLRSLDVLTIQASGTDLLVRAQTWPRRVGLTSPSTRFHGALADCTPGRTIELSLTGPLQSPRMSINGRETPAWVPGLGSGWAFFVHTELLPGWVAAAGSLVWLGLLFIPFGLWLQPVSFSAIGVLVVISALLGVPLIWKLPPLHADEVAAIIAGTCAGAAWHRRLLVGQSDQR